MSNVTVTSMLTRKEVEAIDHMVELGYFCSRSDAIRYFIRKGYREKEAELKGRGKL